MAELKKLMGRPIVKDGKRTKFVNVRFTEDEFKDIVELEQQLGVSRTELIRMRVLADSRKTVVDSRVLIKYLDDVGAEMGRIGNNINQLTKHANVLSLKGQLDPLIIDRFNYLFNDYIKVQQALEATFRKIIRAMGR
ncbi:plasmid mobilization protein [Mucilaginibacter celer]|uniref:Plasmid mobilization relaxosome protein MobC n=1 Tax=Mucilaginibacter celer TaxID=2305508 RepID=A0A494VNJ5_9SPHI|nr:plasmid mobilization relaxosome protein MobC [Mucilaginibacter celer]AYL95311.1 plasmid mobilization relaxosome protein MobC [Mucilaginibacter celer]